VATTEENFRAEQLVVSFDQIVLDILLITILFTMMEQIVPFFELFLVDNNTNQSLLCDTLNQKEN
jgi:hypothetical protein